ncbi:outer membrane beta-barrel protein [Mucilaginibacter sp. X5P1]|uniref:outer membrane beta-barrel family protein n=1 Tax=Mucilaginibacter sp. X5P1 TaxID=2723088 RepID=UPI00161CE8C0|nr:outer membrane beta-barrel family protein [Mucilaginibacter sp. X5P1]MBB6137181.1 outer membrane cobalamin receptor [Mucilaginibacter sp. X5P1]
MRISLLCYIILFSTAGLLLAAPVKAQNAGTERVSFGISGQGLESALQLLQKQTPYVYYYRKADVKNIEVAAMPEKDRSVAETLSLLLQNTFLTFRQVGETIFIERAAGQVPYEISGRVVDPHHEPIPFATVTISRTTDNKAAQVSQTDTGGRFKLEVTDPGSYLLRITAVGMDSLSVAVELAGNRIVSLPDLVLAETTKSLKEVSVTAKKPAIEEKIDRTIVNVNSMISSTGSNALDVLSQSPGVLVDGNGNISFKGKPGVLVLIDGKPTYLSGDALTAYLKSLPASSLDQIELMDNPPAKYDAEGNAGVINIKTKKSRSAGLNGQVSASYGQATYGQTSENLALNYHEGKVNLFANAGYGANENYRILDLGRDYFDAAGNLLSLFRQTQVIRSQTNNSNIKLGMDYAASARTTWGFVLTNVHSSTTQSNPSTDNLFNGSGALDSTIIAENSGKSYFTNTGLNVNYSHRFDSTGKALTFDLDYIRYHANSDQSFLNTTYLPGGVQTSNQLLTDNLPVGIHIYSAKTDFTQPLANKGKIEAGLKSSYVSTGNAANYFDVAGGVSTPDENFSNNFLYKENINAAYLNYDQPFRHFELEAGLRAENTNAFGHQLGNTTHADSSFERHYTNLFPTAFFAYHLDSAGVQQLVLSYGRRINRPYYQALNPFILLSDKFTYSEGNPYLQPQFADNYKLAYNFKSLLSFAVFYNHISNLQNEVIRTEGNIFIDGTGNIGTADFEGISATLSWSPTRWWDLNIYGQIGHNSFKGQLFDTYLNQSSTSEQFNMTSQFGLGNGWSAELSGYYVTRFANGQSVINPFGQLNGGLQKKILHDKGTLRLSGRDLLHTYVADGITNFIPNTTATFRNRFNSQVFTLGFSYSFGAAHNTDKKRETGAASEAGRIEN